MPPVEEVRPGLWSIPVPIPDNPLRYVLVYALELEGAGWPWSTPAGTPTWPGRALNDGLAAAGGSMSDVRAVMVTHIHPDHYGLAGRVREASGAWIGLHPADAVMLEARYGDTDELVANMSRFLSDAGVPDDKLPTWPPRSMAVKSMVTMAVPDVLFEDGSGHRSARLVAPHHLDPRPLPRSRLLLQRGPQAADLRRPRPAPHHPEHLRPHPAGGQPPGRLPRVPGQAARTCATEEVLPAHEYRFADLPGRLRGDHRPSRRPSRRDREGASVEHPGSTAWEITLRLRWSRPWDEIPSVHAAAGQRRDPGPLRPARAARPDPAGGDRTGPILRDRALMPGDRQAERARRIRRQRQRAAGVAVLVILVITGIVVVSCNGGPATTASTGAHPPGPAGGSSTSAGVGTGGATGHRAHRSGPPSIEAGVEAWPLASPLSREAMVDNGAGLTTLGGITPAGASLTAVSTIDPAAGVVAATAGLATPTHDAAAATIGRTTYLFGGGSPDTVATVQAVTAPTIPPATGSTGTVVGRLPQPRSDLAVATVRRGRGTSGLHHRLPGGRLRRHHLPARGARHHRRHPLLHAWPGSRSRCATRRWWPPPAMVYAFGGETPSPVRHRRPPTTSSGSTPPPTGPPSSATFPSPSTARPPSSSTAPSTWPEARPGRPHPDPDLRLRPVLGPGARRRAPPQADAFAGYATVGSGRRAVGYLVGGEVTSQSGQRPGRGGLGLPPVGDLPAAEPVRRAGRHGPVPAPPTWAPC